MPRLNSVILILFSLLVFTAPAIGKTQFKIMTEELKPFAYEENGQIKGICVDIVREVLKIVGHPDNIVIYPWQRAYAEVQHKPGNILFSMGRNSAREHLFKWVGPIVSNTIYFFKKRGSNIHISTKEDAKKVTRISVRENYFSHTLLASEGFENLEITRDQTLNFKKLVNGRADLIATGIHSLKYNAAKAKVDVNDLENTGIVVFDSELYLAFSKDTDDKEIQKWQSALDTFKKTTKCPDLCSKCLP